MQFRPASSRFCQQTLSNCRSRFSCFAWEDSSLDIATARTPPAQWYFDPEVHEADFDILSKGWRLASIHHLAPGTFHAGSTLNIEYLITRDDEGILRGFHNVRLTQGVILTSNCSTQLTMSCVPNFEFRCASFVCKREPNRLPFIDWYIVCDLGFPCV
jgi:hypothetical protein